MKRILLVADISNLYYCIGRRFNGRKLDYKKLMEKAVGANELYRAIAYGAEMHDEAVHFKAALRNCGFEPKYKIPNSYKTLDKEIKHKADWDVGMAMDVVTMLDNVDIVVYATADGDLAPNLEYVKFKGKQSLVLACGISKDLKSIADRYIEITEDMLEINSPT
jgi:uncharacterized LabA/DUF88 family protein